MLTKRIKDKIISSFKTHKNDTGSAPVQIALLTKEIESLTKHLRQHKKDYSSRRGLIKKVSQRRRLLKFLRQDAPEQFEKVIKKLKLRRPAAITAIEEDIKQEEKENGAEEVLLVAAEEEKEKIDS